MISPVQIISKEIKMYKVSIVQSVKAKASQFQTHNHTATCCKKGKVMHIRKNEGYGRLKKKKIQGEELKGISVCRFRFPRFPLDRTRLILGISKDLPDDNVQRI